MQPKSKNKKLDLSHVVRAKASSNNICADGSCFLDHRAVREVVKKHKKEGKKIVLTQGTFDLVHIGHARYFAEAKKYGDILIIGIDSDEKVRARKGPGRPIVPQDERMEIVRHLRSVDYVVLKELKTPKWSLIKAVRPHILIATEDTYNDDQLASLKSFCNKVVVLKRMATTSASAKIRLMQINTAKKLEDALRPRLLSTIEDVLAEVRGEKK